MRPIQYLAMTFAFAVLIAGAALLQNRTSEAETVSEKSSLKPIPDGAVQVGDDAYQVPIDRDSDGCQRYRMFSQNKAVVTAIFYRDRDGNFTMDKSKADCGAS